MKTFISWTRKLIFPIVILAAIIFVLTRDSGRIVNDEVQPKETDKSFPADGPKAPSKENVAKDYTQRVEDLKRSVEKDPKNSSHLTMLATMLMDGHNPNEAIQYFERARKLEPKNISILLDLTVCYAQTGKLDEASSTNKALLKADPKNLTGLYNQGAIYAQQGKMKEAVLSWKSLIKIAPQSDEAKNAADALAQIEKK